MNEERCALPAITHAAVTQDADSSAEERMNSGCFCISLDQVALRTALEDQLGSVDLVAMVEERCPFLFSAMPVFVSEAQTVRPESALLGFPGCVVVVSHDRWFLDRIATHILSYEGTEEDPANWYWFEGNFESYEQNKIERLGADAAKPHRSAYRKLTRD